MRLFVLGSDHRRAPLAALGALRQQHVAVTARLAELRHRGLLAGAVVVDTCHRFEIVGEGCAQADERACRAALHGLFGELTPVEVDGADAVERLLRVAAGLDSLVPGEDEIIGQVARAFAAADASGLSSQHLHSLGNRLIAAARQLRHQRPDRDVPTSIAGLAARLVRQHGDTITVVGAGAMARAAARELHRLQADIVFVNRSVDRAAALAAHFGGRAQSLQHFVAAPQPTDGILLALAGRPLELPLAALPGLRCVVDVSQPTVLDAAVRSRTDLHVVDLQALTPHADAACATLGQWVADTGALARHQAARLWQGLAAAEPHLGHVVELHVDAARDELAKARRNGLARLDDDAIHHIEALIERVARRNAHLHLMDLKAKALT